MAQPITAQSALYGPFEATALIGSDGVEFLNLPFRAVHDSTVIVTMTDNAAQAINATAQTNSAYALIQAEVSLIGSVQGYKTLLKRQFLRSNWGPMQMKLMGSDSYDQFSFRARLFFGGAPFIPSDMVFNAAAPLTVSLGVHVQPRDGGIG